MTESKWTAKLLKALHTHPALKGYTIWKLSDRFTKGVLDFVIIKGKHSEWFEVKMHPNKPEKIQQYWLDKIGDGACWIQARSCGTEATIFHRDGGYNFYRFDNLVEAIVWRCVH